MYLYIFIYVYINQLIIQRGYAAIYISSLLYEKALDKYSSW